MNEQHELLNIKWIYFFALYGASNLNRASLSKKSAQNLEAIDKIKPCFHFQTIGWFIGLNITLLQPILGAELHGFTILKCNEH